MPRKDLVTPMTFSAFEEMYSKAVKEIQEIAKHPTVTLSLEDGERLSKCLMTLTDLREKARKNFGLELPDPYGEPGKGGIQ